jgi:hypothetical protein
MAEFAMVERNEPADKRMNQHQMKNDDGLIVEVRNWL